MHARARGAACMCVCVCMLLRMCMCVCVAVCVCACACACMCVLLRNHACLALRTHTHRAGLRAYPVRRELYSCTALVQKQASDVLCLGANLVARLLREETLRGAALASLACLGSGASVTKRFLVAFACQRFLARWHMQSALRLSYLLPIAQGSALSTRSRRTFAATFRVLRVPS